LSLSAVTIDHLYWGKDVFVKARWALVGSQSSVYECKGARYDLVCQGLHMAGYYIAHLYTSKHHFQLNLWTM
jgi:hypothetical protein